LLHALIPKIVQDALTQVLNATLAEIEPAGGDWAPYELSEKYAARESLRAALPLLMPKKWRLYTR
jgi:hypothetical protein